MEYKAKRCFIGCIRTLRDTDLVEQFTKLIFAFNGSRSPTCGIWSRWMASLSYYPFFSFSHRAVGNLITIKGCARHVFREFVMFDGFYNIMDSTEEALTNFWEKYWEIKDNGTMIRANAPLQIR